MESLSVQLGDPMKYMYHAGRECGDCGDDLMLAEEVVLVQIAVPQMHEGTVIHPAFENPDGSYAYDPYVFHEHCWSEDVDRLHVLLEEQCCAAQPHNYAYGQCAWCKSGLLLGEPVGYIEYGQLTASKRIPNGESSVVFESSKRPATVVCLSCIRSMNDEVIEMWENISYCRECHICTYKRVWRDGVVCDHPQEEE
jgi:hypothetical protein